MPVEMNSLPSLERLNELLEYNPETGEFTWKLSTNGRIKIGSMAGCQHHSGYCTIGVGSTQYQAHRLAWLMGHGQDPGDLQINHINSNRGDNRLANLELVTNRQNSQHASQSGVRQKSLPPGVKWCAQDQKYQARIKINGKTCHLGSYSSLSAASRAYKAIEPLADHLTLSDIDVLKFVRMQILAATGYRINNFSLRQLPKGVTRKGSRFQAQIRVNKKKRTLGTFGTPEEASAAYQEAKARLAS